VGLVEKTFGEELKEYREEKGIGSRKLSKLIGKTESYVSQIERGVIKKPSYYIAFNLFKQMDLDVEEIINILNKYQISPESTVDNNLASSFELYTDESINNKSSNVLEWMDEAKRTLRRSTINNINMFIDKDYSRAISVLENFNSLILDNKETYDFICTLLNYDYKILNSNEKSTLLNTVNNIFISHNYKFSKKDYN
jgi:transcriptional regulator with XRE-family HTH domain